jgi:uncharacterized protein YceK
MLRNIILLFLLCTVLSGGCAFGTAVTRMNIDKLNTPLFGKYPYAAVVGDLKIVPTIGSHHEGDFFGGLALISIPLDFVIDTLLLPIDLVAWPFGFKKDLSMLN